MKNDLLPVPWTDPEAIQVGVISLAQEPERFLRLVEVKRRVGLGKSMIYRLIQEEKFPAPYKLSSFASRWSEREIVDWINRVKDGFEGKKRKVQ